ncbi:unnamed protein product [Leptidea sinapis]|uniref:Uncharacterized protein n=1 Tax=Leptidea sinapis TaxID=189913 RepID=A0A5E4Q146_9NEOP|nr:unnamed protein product [Leptidea sinapis]
MSRPCITYNVSAGLGAYERDNKKQEVRIRADIARDRGGRAARRAARGRSGRRGGEHYAQRYAGDAEITFFSNSTSKR